MVTEARTESDDDASLGVLVVEDETIAAKAHANYIERIDGFRLVGFAKNAQHALAALTGRIVGVDARHIDLVLLDMNLPDGHGIQLLRTMRARQVGVDVIAVTAARDMQVVQNALSLGVLHYILKPFTFPVFKSKLEAFAAYRKQVDGQCGPESAAITQSQIDAAVAGMRAGTGPQRAKGVPEAVQDQIVDLLADVGLSAAEAADSIGVSRVTARRYLEAMADVGLLDRQPRYGSAGRPVLEYVTVR